MSDRLSRAPDRTDQHVEQKMEDLAESNTEWIAEQKLWMVSADGSQCTKITLAIGRPEGDDIPANGPGFCSILLDGLNDGPMRIPGIDRFQALLLAITFMHKRVKQFQAIGFRFFDRHDDDDETTIGKELEDWSDEFVVDVEKLFSQF
jgi:hypothetical protein